MRPVLLAMLLAAGSVRAQPAPVRLDYTVYFAGLPVAAMQAQVAVSPQGYRMALGFHLVGAPAALFSATGSSTADGRFEGDGAVPRELFSSGQMRGKARVTQIDWSGGRPTVIQMDPPLEPEREPVPDALRLHTVDPLSAMAVLLHRLWATGRCEAATRIFDGRWLSAITSNTVGEELLPATGRSPFAGTALHCTVEGTQLAGFFRGADEAEVHKPHRASVWFARLQPGGPLLPVRIELENRGFGAATMYLTGSS